MLAFQWYFCFCSFCPEHKWRRRKFNPSKKSVFCLSGEKKKSPDACAGSEKTDQEKLGKQVTEAEKKKMATEEGNTEEDEDAQMAEADGTGAMGSEDEEDFEKQDDDFDDDDDDDEEDEDEDTYLYQQEDESQEDEDDINATPLGIQSQILPNSSSQASLQTYSSKSVCTNRSSGATNQNTESIRKSNLAMEKQLASKCIITDKNGKNLNSSSCSLDSVFSKATQSMLQGKGRQSCCQLSAKDKAPSSQPVDKETRGQQQ